METPLPHFSDFQTTSVISKTDCDTECVNIDRCWICCSGLGSCVGGLCVTNSHPQSHSDWSAVLLVIKEPGLHFFLYLSYFFIRHTTIPMQYYEYLLGETVIHCVPLYCYNTLFKPIHLFVYYPFRNSFCACGNCQTNTTTKDITVKDRRQTT